MCLQMLKLEDVGRVKYCLFSVKKTKSKEWFS
jgi:hypothetical protein